MEKSNISIATIEMYQLLDRLASEWQIIKHPAPEDSWEVLSDGKTLGLGTSRNLALQSACKNLEEPLENFSIFYLRDLHRLVSLENGNIILSEIISKLDMEDK